MKRLMVRVFWMMLFIQGCAQPNREEVILEYVENAESFYENKDYIGVENRMISAIQEAEQEYGINSEKTAELYLKKAELAGSAMDMLTAIRDAEMIYKNLENKEGMVKVWCCYGDYYSRIDEPEQAIEYYDKIIECGDELGEGINQWKYEAYFYEGLLEDEIEKSIERYKKAESLLEFVPIEKRNIEEFRLYRNIAACYFNSGRYEEAIGYFTKAIEHYVEEEKAIGMLIECYRVRGVCHIRVENMENAMEDTNRAKELLEQYTPDIGIWDRAGVYLNFARIYSLMEEPDYDKALEYGLTACHMYKGERELDADDLEGLTLMKEVLKGIYDNSPYAGQQDFEDWYRENENNRLAD